MLREHSLCVAHFVFIPFGKVAKMVQLVARLSLLSCRETDECQNFLGLSVMNFFPFRDLFFTAQLRIVAAEFRFLLPAYLKILELP
jgi:hypothetical protein